MFANSAWVEMGVREDGGVRLNAHSRTRAFSSSAASGAVSALRLVPELVDDVSRREPVSGGYIDSDGDAGTMFRCEAESSPKSSLMPPLSRQVFVLSAPAASW